MSFCAHCVLQVCLLCFLARDLAVLNDVPLFIWGMFDPSFASASACSLPKTPQCPGIHCNVMLMLYLILALWQFERSSSISFDGLSVWLSTASKADWLSVNITRSSGWMLE